MLYVIHFHQFLLDNKMNNVLQSLQLNKLAPAQNLTSAGGP